MFGSGYRGMTARGHHAEFGVLRGISPELLEGAPSSNTNSCRCFPRSICLGSAS